MDGDEVASQIMLAAERPATRLVVAYVGLGTVRVMSLNVGLEVVCSGEGCESSMSNHDDGVR